MRVSSTRLSRRSFLRLAGAAAAGAALSACSSFTPTSSSSRGKAQLVYQDWSTTWFPPMAREMLDEFHSTHPNIRVYYVPDPENLADRMLDDMQSGVAPDVFQGCCTHFPTWAQKGYVLDLRPYVEADLDKSIIEDWDQAQYKAFFLRDGTQFGLPKYHGALGLYFNRDIFDQYKVDYPDGTWNHDDYLEAMRRLTIIRDDGRTAIWGSMLDISWDRIQTHVNGWGGHFVDPQDPTKSLMGEPAAMDAMRWIQDRMWKDGVMATPLDVLRRSTRDAFIRGKLAMVEDGSWALRDILAGADFPVGIAPFPAGPAKKVTLATTDGFGIYAGTKNPEAAWELMKFLISKEYGRAMAKTNFLQPARESLVDEWVSYIESEFPGKSRGADIATFADGHRQGYSVTSEIFANMGAAQEMCTAAWDQVFVLGREPVDIMKGVSDRITAAQEGIAEEGDCC